MFTDPQLLRRYLDQGSQDAFAEVVQRHINLVYGTAFRGLCGNASLAQDVTQAVFTTLAAQAGRLSKLTSLSAWLYTTTRFTVSHTVRQERRRQDREAKAFTMTTILNPSDRPEAPEIPSELIGRALESLVEGDRDAILLRFIEGQAFGAVGLALGVSEDAARMRTSRALEKIRAFFARQGITSSTAALAAVLAQEGMAAPAGMAGGIAAAALAGKAAGAGAVGGLFASLSTTKSIAVAAGVLALAAVALALRPSAPRGPRSAQRVSQHLAALERKKAAPAEGIGDSKAPAATVAAPSPAAAPENDALARERASARTHADGEAERAQVAEKMAKLKPLYQPGAPLSGVFVTLADGAVLDKPVILSMGQPSSIDLGDNGTYLVTPTLEDDGSIRYEFRSPGPTGKASLPVVVATPWGDYEMGVNGLAFGFIPDQTEPP
jgi:RNA polymerase sigma factor (sigma-70 family)